MLDRVQDFSLATPGGTPPAPLLREGENVWRVESAARAAVLVDGAAYFGALRAALLQAQDSVLIAGWDLDSRMRLVGPSGRADDGLPETLADFLTALVTRRPQLRIRLLLWDYSMVFAFERELMPLYSFLWNTPPQIEICLDDALPFGASHHQKIVVIDDRVAFSGGLDLTGRRWDTSEHLPADERRVDPSGTAYGAFHDVQMLVEGPAAAALGDLLRERWRRAACERLAPPRGAPDRPSASSSWPDAVKPDFEHVAVGIARTLPAHDREPSVREVEALFFDMIESAERLVYVENQFFTCRRTTERLLARMRARPHLEAVVVMPRGYRSWFEHRAMGVGRDRVMGMVVEAGLAHRLRFVYPEVGPEGAAGRVMVHSKVLIVDDRLMRIGSANLCNRSMGFDSECDLVVEARDAVERDGIARLRNGLLGEHLGRSHEEVGTALAQGGLAALLDAPSPDRRLAPVPYEPEAADLPLPMIDALADPIEPLYEESGIAVPTPRRWRMLLGALAGLAVIGGLALAWSYSPFAEPDRLIQAFARLAEAPWAPLAVIAAFVAGGFIAFPVTLLIVATVAVFDGWAGAVLAGTGAVASALATYAVGRTLGARLVRRFIGPRINRIRRRLANRGVLAVTTVRLVPAAPFSFVNLVAGAVGIPFAEYLAGTVLGLMPGLIVMTALGRQVVDILAAPSLGAVALLVGFLALWIVLSLSFQLLVNRLRPAG
ncbi:VTT domain-containing protein [Ancylobacter sonchi]|uniref:VTT domain-containing protein n=1 Tax=Ancylobacter sonchi TaxID=1937790 RepID=UPI001BD4A811|nr:VTT domain-containing protein [Ancylobacter sonchi]MBS7534377.1 VTT domain-containing protein [Ancylobacter sonchi]